MIVYFRSNFTGGFITMFFSDKLRLLRTQANLSQEDLAYELRVSRQSVSKWESGISFPEIEKLISISDYFHVFERVSGGCVNKIAAPKAFGEDHDTGNCRNCRRRQNDLFQKFYDEKRNAHL